jgi:hypothetical protein
MRKPTDADRIRRFMQAVGAAAPEEGTCYLAGGGTAVLLGWRETTIDIDIDRRGRRNDLTPPQLHERGRSISSPTP